MAVSYVDRQTLAVIAPTVVQSDSASTDARYGSSLTAFAIAYLVGAPMARAASSIASARGAASSARSSLWSFVAALHALVPGLRRALRASHRARARRVALVPGRRPDGAPRAPVRQRGRGFGILFTGSSIGAVIAPPLADRLCKGYGFRAAFLGTAIAGLALGAGLALRCLQRALEAAPRSGRNGRGRALGRRAGRPAPRAPPQARDPPARRGRRRERAVPQPDDGLGAQVPGARARPQAGRVRLARLLSADPLRRRLDLRSASLRPASGAPRARSRRCSSRSRRS